MNISEFNGYTIHYYVYKKKPIWDCRGCIKIEDGKVYWTYTPEQIEIPLCKFKSKAKKARKYLYDLSIFVLKYVRENDIDNLNYFIKNYYNIWISVEKDGFIENEELCDYIHVNEIKSSREIWKELILFAVLFIITRVIINYIFGL